MNTKTVSQLLVASALLVSAACGKKDADRGAAAAPAAVPAASATSTAPPSGAAPAALADIDLSKAGAAWQGLHLKGLAGADVTDNGSGGAVVNFTDNTMLQLGAAEDADMKGFKSMLANNYKTVSFSVDTPTEIVYSAVSDMGGTEITGYGFSTVVPAGALKVSCGSTYDDVATATRMLAVCKSLSKS